MINSSVVKVSLLAVLGVVGYVTVGSYLMTFAATGILLESINSSQKIRKQKERESDENTARLVRKML